MWFDYAIPFRLPTLKGFKPWATWGLIAANTLFFSWELGLIREGLLDLFLRDYGLTPDKLLHHFKEFGPTLLTHMFIHGNVFHILGNMYYLWVFGPPLEQRVKSLPFLAFYLAAGILGALTQVGFDADSSVPCMGASGAVAGVLGATFVLKPLSELRLGIRIPNFLFLGPWFLLQMVRGVGSLTAAVREMEQVAYWAHVGGFTAGSVGIYLWLITHHKNK